ncbi:MAG TPA: hypothetical protein VE990_20190 [Acidimicrobiales bacterium]|nr:hypothetical protein [Acidimicrobiales bacterium]
MPASASAATGHGVTLTFNFTGGDNITSFDLQPVPPPPEPQLVIPSNCPFDLNAVFTMVANGVNHQTGNKNGFWAGGTATGPTALSEGAGPALYTGQATVWGGFGTNQSFTDTTGQGEEGETFHFHGTSTTGQSLDVRIDYQFTLNNQGVQTASHEAMTCS